MVILRRLQPALPSGAPSTPSRALPPASLVGLVREIVQIYVCLPSLLTSTCCCTTNGKKHFYFTDFRAARNSRIALLLLVFLGFRPGAGSNAMSCTRGHDGAGVAPGARPRRTGGGAMGASCGSQRRSEGELQRRARRQALASSTLTRPVVGQARARAACGCGSAPIRRALQAAAPGFLSDASSTSRRASILHCRESSSLHLNDGRAALSQWRSTNGALARLRWPASSTLTARPAVGSIECGRDLPGCLQASPKLRATLLASARAGDTLEEGGRERESAQYREAVRQRVPTERGAHESTSSSLSLSVGSSSPEMGADGEQRR